MRVKKKTILGIETSCDDTSICLLEGTPGHATEFPKVLAHLSFSSEKILSYWGGVVPEIAARNHLEKLTPLLSQSFKSANIELNDIDGIAVTTHPGLLGPLLTGLGAAKSISLLTKKPILAVNHLYAHLEAIHFSETISYPYLGLLVSGGHTMILHVKSETEFNLLGTTIDDAAGEAFDKGGKILGLPYPAGRVIDELAAEGNPKRFEFPIGLKGKQEANMSFSGLKTALSSWKSKQEEKIEGQLLKDVCASYQRAIVEALVYKVKKVCSKNQYNSLPLVIGGGVACNSYLRKRFAEVYQQSYFVKPGYCTDNGAMIAIRGLRLFDSMIPFPDCLALDARGKFIDKNAMLENLKRGKNAF